MCIVHSYPSGYAPYTERYPNFWNQGIINPLPSKLEEVYGRFLQLINSPSKEEIVLQLCNTLPYG